MTALAATIRRFGALAGAAAVVFAAAGCASTEQESARITRENQLAAAHPTSAPPARHSRSRPSRARGTSRTGQAG